MPQPDTIYLYRITHIDNLDFILNAGKITCSSNPDGDPNYIGIGDSTLINSRSTKQINIAPNGNFLDYVAFYFGARSPMLYNIQKGYNNVMLRQPNEIIYLVTNFERIRENDCQYVFTDGHAYHHFSQFFNQAADLDKVDWAAVNLQQWNDTEADMDRKRRKQAEFLVHNELPMSAIGAIIVYDEPTKLLVQDKITAHNMTCPVIIKSNWYY